jgi:YD repeat-containing protein
MLVLESLKDGQGEFTITALLSNGTTTTYDAERQVATVTDPLGNRTSLVRYSPLFERGHLPFPRYIAF